MIDLFEDLFGPCYSQLAQDRDWLAYCAATEPTPEQREEEGRAFVSNRHLAVEQSEVMPNDEEQR